MPTTRRPQAKTAHTVRRRMRSQMAPRKSDGPERQVGRVREHPGDRGEHRPAELAKFAAPVIGWVSDGSFGVRVKSRIAPTTEALARNH